MIDRSGRIEGVAPISEVTAPRPVRAHIGREQIDLFERMVEQGSQSAEPGSDQEMVTVLTKAEIEQIEAHLPSESTVASILGRVLDFYLAPHHRHSRHAPSIDGHIDEDA